MSEISDVIMMTLCVDVICSKRISCFACQCFFKERGERKNGYTMKLGGKPKHLLLSDTAGQGSFKLCMIGSCH